MAQGAIVVTGGDGFVGRHLVAELRRQEREVVVWDLPEVDITRAETYRQRLIEIQPDWVVHLAAIASAAVAGQNEALARRVNVEATESLLEQITQVSSRTQMLAVSTADIYGQGSSTPLPELPLAQAQPLNPYAQTKWEMEKMIEEKFKERVIRVRPFPHIGPGQTRGYVTADFASQIAAIESHFAKAPRNKAVPVIKVGNLETQRDFTDVRDVARAYSLLMERGKMGEVYHVASGVAVSIQKILDDLLAQAKVKIAVEQDPAKRRPSDTPVLVGDASKLGLLGWRREISLGRSLRDILSWWRQAV